MQKNNKSPAIFERYHDEEKIDIDSEEIEVSSLERSGVGSIIGEGNNCPKFAEYYTPLFSDVALFLDGDNNEILNKVKELFSENQQNTPSYAFILDPDSELAFESFISESFKNIPLPDIWEIIADVYEDYNGNVLAKNSLMRIGFSYQSEGEHHLPLSRSEFFNQAQNKSIEKDDIIKILKERKGINPGIKLANALKNKLETMTPEIKVLLRAILGFVHSKLTPGIYYSTFGK